MRILMGLCLSLVMGLFLVACGSDDSPVVKEGVFIDSAVQGLTYTCGGQTGTTDASGTFRYEEGQVVEFKVGNVIIGSATGSATMTPVTLVAGAADTTDTRVQNMARFLQSLDSDGDASNGISITDTEKELLTDVTIDFTVSTDAFASDMSIQLPGITLVSLEDAINHLNDSINNLSTGYSLSDLTGSWYSTGDLTPGAGATAGELANYGVEAGTLVVQADGSFSWTTSEGTESGSLSISETGLVDTAEASDHLGWYMNAAKDVMTLVFDNTTYNEQGTILFVKAGDTYSQSDLTGSWYFTGDLTPGAGARANELANFGVEAGTLVVQNDGSFSWTTSSETETGILSISETGLVDTAAASDHLGWYMNAGKDVMTLVFDNTTHHEQGTIIFVKAGDAYSQSDLAGSWYSTGDLTPGAGATTSTELENFGVEAGSLVVQSDGSFSWTTTSETESGSLSVSDTGLIDTAAASDHLGWYMNAGKDVMTLVFDNTTHHEQGMIMFVKKN